MNWSAILSAPDRAEQVLVFGQAERALHVLLLQVEAILEDGLYVLPADDAVLEYRGAGRFQSNHAVLLP